MAKANVLLVGGGAVGTMAAVNIEAGGLGATSMVLRSNHNLVREEGYMISSIDHGLLKGWRPSKVINAIPDVSAEALPPYDYVVCATKNCPDIPPTLETLIAPAITPGHTVIVLIQNGVNIEKPMFAAFPSNIVLSGVSYINAIESKPGTILHEKFDVLSLGPFHNPSLPVSAEMTAAKDFIRIYSAAGKTQAPYCEDVPAARWGKMVMNAAVNPLSAITGLNFGQLRLTESSEMMLMRPAMEEVVSVAKALGVVLPEGLVDAQINIVPIDLYSVPSMMLDVQEGNYLEFETMVGEPMREGRKAGVPTPTLNILYELCRAIQWKTKLAKGLVTQPPKRTPAKTVVSI